MTQIAPNSARGSQLLFGIIVLAYVVYAVAFIYTSSSTEINGERYFVLFDDAMISMRFAKNFANGYGLLWNPGEPPVEGFTNLLWTLYMSLWHLLRVPESKICLVIQITDVIVQIASICLTHGISEKIFGKGKLVALLPPLLTAFYYPLNFWSLGGMEVGVLSLLLLWIASIVQRLIGNRNEDSDQSSAASQPGMARTALLVPLAYFLFWIAIFVRMDSAVPLLASIVFLFCFDAGRRMQHLIQGGIALLSSLGLLEVLRLAYYHDLLPNTYYLKVTGFPVLSRIAQGAFNLYTFVLKSNPWFFAIAAFGLFKFKAEKFVLYLAAIVLGQFAYSVYVGGDAWESTGNRYITQAMPLFFIIFACGIQALSQIQLNNPRLDKWPGRIAAVIACVSLLSFNNVGGLKYLFLLEPHESYGPNMVRLELGLALRKVVRENGHIAATLCGILPYFADRNCIDMLGKCDPVVAKEEMHHFDKIVPQEMSWRWFYPGHMKWNYKHSIGDLKPDVVVELWASPEEAEPFLSSSYKKSAVNGIPVYLRAGSTQIDWQSPLVKEVADR